MTGALTEPLCRAALEVARSLPDESPCFYLHDLDVAAAQLARLRAALPPRVRIYYAMKANPHPAVLAFLARRPELDGVEVASGGEIALAVEHVAASRLAFTGPGKSPSELALALRAGVGQVHLESLVEAHRLDRAAGAAGRAPEVLVRVNPSFRDSSLFNRCSGGTSKFGVDEDQAPEVVRAVCALPRLAFRGVHVHAGSGVLDAGELAAYAEHVFALAERLAERGHPIRRVDLGGGFGLDYEGRGRELDVERFGRELAAMLDRPARRGWDVIVEPGRYLVGPAGHYVAPVRDVKRSHGRAVIVTAGGTNHQRRPAAYGVNHPLAVVARGEPPLYEGQPRVEREVVALVGGPLCTASDLLAREVYVERAEVGDLVVVGLSGAYGQSASPHQFLSHPPAHQIFFAEGRRLDGPAPR